MFTCPKCGGQMQTYSRAGLHVEQCNSCRGVFLDAGELERIVEAEGQWQQQHHAQSVPSPPPPMPGQYGAPVGAHLGGHAHHGHHHHHRPHGKKHPKSFLGEIFDL